MAGRRHSKTPLRPTREAARDERMARRLATAQTPEDRAAAAFDGLRMAARHSPARGRRALEEAVSQMAALTAWIRNGDRQ